MKKLKFNSFIAFLTIGTSLLILSCSKDEEKAPQSIITTGNNQTNSTSCDILGSLNVGSGTYPIHIQAIQ